MAGSISRKVRGVLAKFWVYLQLLLNYKGVRADFNKTGGLFRKKGQAEPVSLDLGRWISIHRLRAKGYVGSNPGRLLRI